MSTFLLSSIPEHALVRLGALGEQMVRSRFFWYFGLPARSRRAARRASCSRGGQLHSKNLKAKGRRPLGVTVTRGVLLTGVEAPQFTGGVLRWRLDVF